MIWISAISLALSILVGLAAPVIGMVKAFGTLQVAGAADPAALAGDISLALIGSLVVLPFAFASLALFIVAIVRHRKFSDPGRTRLPDIA